MAALNETPPVKVRVAARVCPACDRAADGAPPLAQAPPEWAMTACRACGFVYLAKGPVYDELVTNLAWERTRELRSADRLQRRPVSHGLSLATRGRLRLLPRKNVCSLILQYAAPGNVLDLGCGGGTQFHILDSRYVPFGIDVSQSEAEQADAFFATRGGSAVNAPCLEGMAAFPEAFFAAATLRSYLEHESRPRDVLAALHPRMRPGGMLIIKVPNYGSLNRRVMGRHWCGYRFPDHLNYFTPASLHRMVIGTGYRVHRFGLIDHLPTSDNMWMIAARPE